MAVIGVVGGSGGVGASTFAAVLAAAAGSALLVDLDAAAGGVDVLLGIEQVPGARWSGVRVAGGHLDPQLLLAGLPRWGQVPVLAVDQPELPTDAVQQVLGAAAAAVDVLVLDLPRADCAARAAGLLHCELVLLLARGDASGLVAAHAALSALPQLPAGLVVRRATVPAARCAELVGCRLLGELPALAGAQPGRDPARPPRATRLLAQAILAALPAGGPP